MVRTRRTAKFLFRAAAVSGALSSTPARPVTAPVATPASGLLRVRLLPVITVITVSAAMPVPVTIWPTERPLAFVVGSAVRPAAMVPATAVEPAAMTFVT